MLIRLVPAVLLAASIGLAGVPAHANLVSNGGFETEAGNPLLPSGWSVSGTGIASDTAQVNSGSYDVAFTALSTDTNPGTLSQLIATAAGQSYTLSFWLLDQNVPSGAETFNVTFGGFTDAITASNLNGNLYTNLVLSIPTTAVTSTSTTLTFQGLQDSSTGGTAIFNLDDVSLTANSANIPEPADAALLGAGALLTLGFAARRGRGAGLPPRG